MKLDYTLEELKTARTSIDFSIRRCEADVSSLTEQLQNAKSHLAWLQVEAAAMDRAIVKLEEE